MGIKSFALNILIHFDSGTINGFLSDYLIWSLKRNHELPWIDKGRTVTDRTSYI